MIRYTLHLDRPSTHLFGVELHVDMAGLDHVEIEFPAWSPGRYFIYDFARNVQEMCAFAGHTQLHVEKISKGTWRIASAGYDEIRISYRMFGDTLSGTFSQLDDRHAAINGSSLFGYIVGRQHEPIELEVHAPEGWKIYSALRARKRNGRPVLHAANYDLLIDSPIEIGNPIARAFRVDDVTYHVILDIVGAEGSRRSRELKDRIDRFVADTEKTVRAYVTTFGRPEFDEYYFLVNVDPYAPSGDGMEHLYSTRLVINGYLTNDDHYDGTVNVMSHEFFHIWNVKRLRPAELGPFDYTRERHTTLLWFAEGFTQYYGHLMLCRAGVWEEKRLYKQLAVEINNVDSAPGRFHRNLRDSSFDTWHAVSPRNPIAAISNFKNTYVNYYHKGAVVAWMLDMEIRRVTADAKSLDDVIRVLYRKMYEEMEIRDYFLRGTGYTESDVYEAIKTVTGRSLRSFLRHAIESTEEIDYARYLKHVGLTATRIPKKEGSNPDRPQIYLGIIVPDAKARGESELVPVTNVLADSPAERAGISAGDLIVALDGERVDGRRWDWVLAMKKPGESIEVSLFRGSRLMTITLRTEERDTRPFRIEPLKNATPRQKSAREKWLSK